jgi:hypothetical protein
VWVDVLGRVCQVTYRQLRSVSNKDELEEFTVHNTSASVIFTATLPFSWLLYDLVNNALAGARNAEGEKFRFLVYAVIC